jgi:hypothetical protein
VRTVADITRGLVKSANDHRTAGWNEALEAVRKAAADVGLSHDDLCRLSRSFNENANLAIGSQDYRINEWLKNLLAGAK